MNYFYKENREHYSYWEDISSYRLPSISRTLPPFNMIEWENLKNNAWIINSLDLILGISALYAIIRISIFVIDLSAYLLSFLPNIFTKNVVLITCGSILGYLAYVLSLGLIETENNLATFSRKLFDGTFQFYKEFLVQFTNYCFGLNLSNQSENEATIWGSLLLLLVSCVIFYYGCYVFRYKLFTIFLVSITIYLYFQTFTITPQTMQFYTNNKSFIIDHERAVAYIAPSIIPKILLILVVTFQLFQNLLKFFRLALRFSFRIMFMLFLALLFVNTILSLLTNHSQVDDQRIVNISVPLNDVKV